MLGNDGPNLQQLGAVGQRGDVSLRLRFRSLHGVLRAILEEVRGQRAADMRQHGLLAERGYLSLRLLGRLLHGRVCSRFDPVLGLTDPDL